MPCDDKIRPTSCWLERDIVDSISFKLHSKAETEAVNIQNSKIFHKKFERHFSFFITLFERSNNICIAMVRTRKVIQNVVFSHNFSNF